MKSHESEPSLESQYSHLRFEEGWQEILEAPDALDYQTWISDLVDFSSQQINKEFICSKEVVLTAWLKALELVADVAIDPEEASEMSEAEMVETALITLQTNIASIGWDHEGLAFTVPNMFTGEEATIDIRDLID